jgi:hypothetical protein
MLTNKTGKGVAITHMEKTLVPKAYGMELWVIET